ncbi:MAG: matrixin family metalloprotease [Acidobacteriota bacterium]|nr:matrixin family metalloprotease [Acidobacteriota bacterium]
MIRRSLGGLFLAWTIALPMAHAYIRFAPNGGSPLIRADYANVRFHINDGAVAGLNNADGQPFITGDSDPVAALRLAAASWNSIPTTSAQFASMDVTSNVNNSADGLNVIVFRDTPEIRSVLGSALAMNVYSIFPGGLIAETDIIFNPTKTFSTTLAPGAFDIQSVAAHELGHALGANHSGILSATMFQSTQPGNGSQRLLSADDAMFASAVYPAPGATPFGTISGTLTAADGSSFRGGLVTAIDSETGAAIGSFSSLVDGTYSVQTPPGNYFVSAEPLGGAVQPGNLYLTTDQKPDTAVQPGFVGGVDTPTVLSVAAGAVVNGDLAVSLGASPISITQTALGPAGGFGESLTFRTGPQSIVSGQAVDLLFFGPGIDASLSDQNVRILGPGIALRPGSVRLDPYILANGMPIMRATLDVTARSNMATASLIISKDGNSAVFSGGLILSASQ